MSLCTIVNCSQQVERSVYSSLFGTCEAASALSSFRHPSARKMLRYWSKSRGEAARWVYGIWGEAKSTGFVQLWEEKVKRKSYCSLKLPNGRTERWQSQALPRGGALKFSHTDGMRNDGHKLENRKFSLGVRGEKCTMEVVGCLSRLPRKAVESLPLEILKNLLASLPATWSTRACFVQGTRDGDLRKSLPTSVLP